MNSIRVICTGNPNNPGIANELLKEFPNTYCLHRSMGVDLVTQQGLDYFKSIINQYDVFVNVSNIPNATQEKLLKIAHQAGMKGHVFNIGSIAEYEKWSQEIPTYSAEKLQLRKTSLELCSKFFKTTHVVVGGFQDYENNSSTRMHPNEIIKIIKYIIDSPINIPIVGIEKIDDNI